MIDRSAGIDGIEQKGASNYAALWGHSGGAVGVSAPP
jgi:hypothetical protein